MDENFINDLSMVFLKVSTHIYTLKLSVFFVYRFVTYILYLDTPFMGVSGGVFCLKNRKRGVLTSF